MRQTRPLPGSLIQRYHGWKATTFADNSAWYKRLGTEGQRPRAMVITCCDSRVNVNALFGAEQGEFFIHRNIANLVPPCEPDGLRHGTSAAIEYAVTSLKVSQLIVLGHSQCGGVQGCEAMCSGHAPELEAPESFVGRWMDLLRPGWEEVREITDDVARQEALEKRAVLTSIDNLMTFPFVRTALETGSLALHGVWNDIVNGALECYDAQTDRFVVI